MTSNSDHEQIKTEHEEWKSMGITNGVNKCICSVIMGGLKGKPWGEPREGQNKIMEGIMRGNECLHMVVLEVIRGLMMCK